MLKKVSMRDLSTLERTTERAVNWVAASAVLALTLPVMVFIAVAIKCDTAGPVLVRRQRIRDGQAYSSLKFRTTRDGDPLGPLTRVGRVLRYGGLENLPEIVNVFRGHLSCTGAGDRFFLN